MFRLQDLRDRRRIKFLGYAFMALILVSFIFFYGWQKGNRSQGYQNAVEIARIKSDSINPLEQWEKIDSSRLKDAQAAVRLHYRNGLDERATKYYDQLKRGQTDRLIDSFVGNDEAIKELANTVILERYAKDINFRVTRDQVKAYLTRQLTGISDRDLDMLANSQGMTRDQYVERYRESMQDSQVLEIVGLTAQSSLFELWQEYSLAHEKLTLRLAAFPSVKFEKQVETSEADLQTFLDAHRQKFHKTAERRYAFVKKTADSINSGIAATDDELKAFYQQNQVRYMRGAGYLTEDIYIPLTGDATTSAAQQILAAERDDAAKSTDWNALVERLKQKYPQVQIFYHKPNTYFDANSAERSQIYRDAMQHMEDNKISQPIIDENGAYLFRVTKHREEGVTPFDEIKSTLLKDYRTEKAKDATKTFYQKLKDELTQGSHSTMQSYAQAVGLNDELTTRVERNTLYIPDIGNVQKVEDHLRGLELNDFSDVITLPDSSLAVLQVVEDKKEYDPPLSEIRGEVERALKEDRSGGLAKTAADNALKLIKGGAPFNETLADAPIKPLSTLPIERTDPVSALDSPLIDFKEKTVGIDVGSRGVSPYGKDSDNPDGYAVWELVKIDPASKQQFNTDLPKFQRDYLDLQREAIKREWLNAQREKLDFTILPPKR